MLCTRYLQVFTSGSTRNLWFILLMYNLSLGMALLVPRLSDLLDSRHYVQLYTAIYKYIQYIQLCTRPKFIYTAMYRYRTNFFNALWKFNPLIPLHLVLGTSQKLHKHIEPKKTYPAIFLLPVRCQSTPELLATISVPS